MIKRMLWACLALLMMAVPLGKAWAQDRPADFVDMAQEDPSLVMDIRYHGPHNFLGQRVDGYEAPKCLLTKPAAQALMAAQRDLRHMNLSLKIYDCYRPQRAVAHFVRWAKDIPDTKTKAEFYPQVDKSRLFADGYIAERSSHSRGGTVDLTIVPLPVPAQAPYTPGQKLCPCTEPVGKRFGDNSLDMGTGFDCFSPLSHTANPSIGPTQRVNRALLKTLMEKHGFVNYDKEWWHYTLKNEPHPETYYDFPVK